MTVTISVNVIVDRPVSGASSTPARPASAAPIPHVITASRLGDHPMVCTARSFCAAAVMARPMRLYLANAQSAKVTTSVTPMM